MSDKDRAKCSMCGSEASYYSLYEKKQVALCSRNCQEKYNTKRANIPNILLIQLEDEEQNEEQDNNSEGEDSLFEACHRGEENNTILISSLESGQSPNQKNKQGQTLLTYSISKGDIRTLRILLSAGADVDEADDSSRTPLMVAANMGADKKMGLLLKRGANAMMQDAEGKTALHLTESNTTSDCAKLLLQYEPKLLNVKNNFDQTAAHLIAGAGNKAVQTILLDKGAQINGLDNLGRAPLHWAVLQKAETCVPLLLDHDDGHKAMDLPDRFGSCPIHYAIQLDNVDIVSMLTEKGCNVNIKDTTGRTALLLAAAQGSWDSCQRLAPKCDDINATDNEGFSALHHAAGNGESAICSLLIKHGADVNLRNKKEQTPMFPAVANAHVEVVHTLVEQGASCDAVKDVNGRNPAHYAAERGHKGIIRVILQYSEVCVGEGCDMCNPDENPIHFKDNEGHSALYLTAVNKHIDCLKILIKRGVFVDDEGYGLLVEMGLIDMVDENKRLTDKEEPDNSAEETPAEEVEESSDNKENEQENEKAEQHKQATPITAEGAAAWRKKYLDQKKRTISLEEKLNKLRSQLDLHHRRMLSQMERREDNTTLPKRVRDSQLTLTQQSYQNDLLKMKVEITEARVTSEAMLRNLLQKEMNGIRDLRTDYRNAHKTFSSKQQDTSRLLDAPDWLIRAKSQPSRLPQNGKWGKAVRKTAYLEQFKKAKDYERRHSNSTEKTENHSPKLSEGTKG